MAENATETLELATAIDRLDKDIRAAAKRLSTQEARYLVDTYYTMQEDRIRAAGQIRALSESGEPNEVLGWLFKQSETLESRIKSILDGFSMSSPVGRWARAQKGVGPVLASGLLAHIDIEKAPTAGHIMSFAGLTNDAAWLGSEGARKAVAMFVNPNEEVTISAVMKIAGKAGCSPKWLARRIARNAWSSPIEFKGWESMDDEAYVRRRLEDIMRQGPITVGHVIDALAIRPWNARLKVIAWKLGESFTKVCNSEGALYGQVYKERKALETERNLRGEYRDQAAAVLQAKRIGKDTEAFKHYSQGMLPPAHIHARAKRYAVKLFLSHLHEVMYWDRFGKAPPDPYAIAHLDHVHRIPVPPGGDFGQVA